MRDSEHIKLTRSDGIYVIQLSIKKPLDLRQLNELHDEFIDFVKTIEGQRIIVDFEHVDFCPTSVINTLVVAHRELAATNGQVALSGMQPVVREAFQILKLAGNVFDIHDTVATTRRAFGIRESSERETAEHFELPEDL